MQRTIVSFTMRADAGILHTCSAIQYLQHVIAGRLHNSDLSDPKHKSDVGSHFYGTAIPGTIAASASKAHRYYTVYRLNSIREKTGYGL
ncbi:TPA: hypothetical protein HA338_15030 [Methanosarcina acetivorans]|uniref:Uncharacterized protein n=2 Tax=Methanosarcina acetivorans TaxID=2214 RepID=Q8TNF8_METAC|nr:hypothetical protein [Methanosarcina acetivorans]AAM05720.1 predicted protein [Methanosarcina acetivorans C2A]HIH95274.1 hypothetical protein [Methanosarcina acetivorans]